MSNFQHGAGFRIAGSLVRKWVAQSFKVARVTVAVDHEKGTKKIDLVSFAPDVIEEIAALRDGALFEVTGRVDMEKLKDKQGNEVKIDGYAKWVPSLSVQVIKVQGASKAPAPMNRDNDNSDVDF